MVSAGKSNQLTKKAYTTYHAFRRPCCLPCDFVAVGATTISHEDDILDKSGPKDIDFQILEIGEQETGKNTMGKAATRALT